MFRFGARDVVWASVVFFATTWFVQCRPAWSARRFVEREADAGFETAFSGHRFVSGNVITPTGGGTHVDPAAPMVQMRRFELQAERVSWNGNKAEFVILYRI